MCVCVRGTCDVVWCGEVWCVCVLCITQQTAGSHPRPTDSDATFVLEWREEEENPRICILVRLPGCSYVCKV